MKSIKVEITGITPLLMNSAKGMLVEPEADKVRSTSSKKRDFKVEAESVTYRNKNNNLFIPATAIKGTLLNACSFKKVGKYAAKSIMAAAVRIQPDEIELMDLKGKKIDKYDIDLRTIVNRTTGRIVKARPKIENWKAQFTLNYREELIPEPKIILQILSEAGERVGILDFRPQKNGEFGCFKITEWKVEK